MNNNFKKDDQNKPKLSLLPVIAKSEIAKVLEYGATKYGYQNWKHCDDRARYIDAALRHIDCYIEGTVIDEESGYHHLAHAVASLMFIISLEQS